MLIEIVSHVWAKEMTHFAPCLCYQASSLILHRPKNCSVCLTICWCPNDETGREGVKWATTNLSEAGMQTKEFRLSEEEIGRRCIGRNVAALNTRADLVWFADVDQVFRDGVLDRLAGTEWPEGASMIYPRAIKIHRDHATGDELVRDVPLSTMKTFGPIDVDPSSFVEKRYRKAIGGVQIVRGDFARKYGYLNEQASWLRPTSTPFGDFRDDVAYRRFCRKHGPIVGMELPGMHRIRHTRTTYQ